MPDLPPDLAVELERSRKDAIRAKREGVLLIRRPLLRGEEPRSYIGGLPHLREDLNWPVSARTGLPLSFIAQIDLRDVPRPHGVFFPAEGMLWFFADFSEEQFIDDVHTRVLFDPHARVMAREREAPAGLPTLSPRGHDQYGWIKAQHPRSVVEPKAALFLHLFDTFYDQPYERPTTWEDFLRDMVTPKAKRRHERDVFQFFGPGVYMRMIDELREEAVHRAIGVRRADPGFWHEVKTGFGEAHWPATSIDAEYALMRLGSDFRLWTGMKDHPCPLEVVTDLAARVQDQIRIVRAFGPRPLSPAERVPIKALLARLRRGLMRFNHQRHPVPGQSRRTLVRVSRREMGSEIMTSYPHAAFEILSTMPEAERYVPAELMHPYQEWTAGDQMYFHQMFGHGSSAQDAPQRAQDYVLLLQIGGSRTLGFPLAVDAVMHYWIPKRDLARGRFDQVVGTWESG
jgi:hypothetical protein